MNKNITKKSGFILVKSGLPNRGRRYLTGFTLMEILVATSIFAIILIFATVTIAQSSGFRSRLTTMRTTSEESRELADMITRDVHSANGNERYCLAGDVNLCQLNYNFKNGLAFFRYDNSGTFWSSIYNTSPSGSDFNNFSANVLMIATKDSYIVYSSYVGDANHNGRVCYGRLSFTDPNLVANPTYYNEWLSDTGSCGNAPSGSVAMTYYYAHPEMVIFGSHKNSSGTIDNNSNVDIYLNFGGFLPDDDFIKNNPTSNQQPYVLFYITSETANYVNLPANERNQTHILSAATSTSYNP